MKREIFKKSANSIINKMISKIRNYKEQNNLHLYELLYSKDNQKIIEDSKRVGEPYYSFSKKTSTEMMSRILNHKGKITDEVARIIADNMGINYTELVWRVNKKGMKQLDFLYFSHVFWCNLFYDALNIP